ncbi:MotA/TolQ/ExbB proton channel family protein [Sulfurospirillum arcachonense]|uniref:MotA/TolQ/ExbB proton channel family protein n=1 Tax=Sulfurospirillum arcachonense TaxID=57666 RepID=UPI0004B9E976|nr:MotA/TolQ/ExbB proton channel family protein [Sulfurospirillum arcachonense]
MSEVNLSGLEEKRQPSCFGKVLSLLLFPFIIFLTVLAGFMTWIPFRVEIHSVVMIGIIFIIYLFFLKHNAFYASCKFIQDVPIFKEELKEYIQKNILIIGQTKKANASYDDFAKNYTADLRDENFASVAAGIFPTLGILGTFISIALSMPDFSSQTSAVLEKEISLLLGGVGTAFYVSIYGIFLSIWWILFDKTGLSKFEKKLNAIKLDTKSLFWNKEEIEQTYFQKSMENFEKLNQVFNNFAQDELIENMNKTMAQRVEMFGDIISLEQEAVKKATSQMNESVKVMELAQNANEHISLDFKQMLLQFKEASSKFEQSASSLGDISNSLKQKDEHLVKITESLKNISPENLELIHQSIIKNFDTMKKDTDQIGWAFNTYLNEFDDKFGNKLKETLLTIDSEVVKIVNALEQVKNLENS